MRVVSVTVVKNESDIIESFIRYNSQFLSHMHVIDHNSADSTAGIIQKLIGERLPVTLSSAAEPEHQQAQRLTRLSRNIAASHDADIIVPLDADEFIAPKDPGGTLQTCLYPAMKSPVLMPWLTYVPSPEDDESEPDCLKRITHRRESEGRKQFFKVVFPAQALSDQTVSIGEGSHMLVKADGGSIEHMRTDAIRLAHFPVRSSDQLLSKILLGELALRLKTARAGDEGYHWSELYKAVRGNLCINKADFFKIAGAYAGGGTSALIHDPIANITYGSLHYLDMADTNVLKRVLAFAEYVVSIKGPNKVIDGIAKRQKRLLKRWWKKRK